MIVVTRSAGAVQAGDTIIDPTGRLHRVAWRDRSAGQVKFYDRLGPFHEAHPHAATTVATHVNHPCWQWATWRHIAAMAAGELAEALSDDDLDLVLWEHTAFPFDTDRAVYRQLVAYLFGDRS